MLIWSKERSAPIDLHLRELAAEAASRHLENLSNAPGYRQAGRAQCESDTELHLCHLSEAITTGRPSLFGNYVEWSRTTLASRGIVPGEFARSLEHLNDVIRERLPQQTVEIASEYIRSAMAKAQGAVHPLPTFLPDGAPYVDTASVCLELLLERRRNEVAEILTKLLGDGMPLGTIYKHILEPCQREVGRLWQLNRITVAHEHYCTEATRSVMTRLTMVATRMSQRGRRLIAASIDGELHDVGVHMIADMLEVNGWEVFYLGANTPGGAVFQLAALTGANVVALSATMPFNLHRLREATVAIDAVVPRPSIVVGGQAFQREPKMWEETGADGYANDVLEAVQLIDTLGGDSHIIPATD
jgi:MerR family transcriptional regulator, light-induced transcriptional regulator